MDFFRSWVGNLPHQQKWLWTPFESLSDFHTNCLPSIVYVNCFKAKNHRLLMTLMTACRLCECNQTDLRKALRGSEGLNEVFSDWTFHTNGKHDKSLVIIKSWLSQSHTLFFCCRIFTVFAGNVVLKKYIFKRSNHNLGDLKPNSDLLLSHFKAFPELFSLGLCSF